MFLFVEVTAWFMCFFEHLNQVGVYQAVKCVYIRAFHMGGVKDGSLSQLIKVEAF